MIGARDSLLREYFDRVERAWAGRADELRRSRVMIIGAGAIGSNLAHWLARAGVGEFIIIDGDYVEPHNLERTACYTERDVGKPKVEVLARCIRGIRRRLKPRVLAIHSYLDSEFFSNYYPRVRGRIRRVNLMIVGVDNDWARVSASMLANEFNIPMMVVSFGPNIGRVLYFPRPRDGPCFLCTLTRDDWERMGEVLGYNMQATCPKCGRRFKIINWRWPQATSIEGLNDYQGIRPVIENGKVIALHIKCPYCGNEFQVTTPDAPAPVLSEWAYLTTSYAYYWAVRHLLGRPPKWNVAYILMDDNSIKILTYQLATSDEHAEDHVNPKIK